MDLFKVIPDNFFSLLSSKNKSVYAGCIIEAFKIYEEGSILGIDKKIVIEVGLVVCGNSDCYSDKMSHSPTLIKKIYP